MNIVTFIGNIGADPDVRFTQNGTAVAKLSVAINESFTTAGGERQEKTVWVGVEAWKALAETIQKHCHKGDRIAVTGSLDISEWEDKNGTRRSRLFVRASRVDFLTAPRGEGAQQPSSASQPAQRKPETPSGTSPAPAAQGKRGAFDDFEDDVPF